MRKEFLLLLLSFLFHNGIISQPCLPSGITFSNQAQIDNFLNNYPDCTEIAGDVNIHGPTVFNLNGLSIITSIGGDLVIGKDSVQSTLLTNLVGLNQLQSVVGSIHIYQQNNLVSLSGFENLVSIGGSIRIEGNPLLTSLDGLNGLQSVGITLSLIHNTSLLDIESLENLDSIGVAIYISSNDSLQSLQGLNNINTPNINLTISSTNTLTNLEGLNSLTSIADLTISYNDDLSDIIALSNCSISGDIEVIFNKKLGSLLALHGVSNTFGDIYIQGNDSLTSLIGLENLNDVEGLRIVDNNALIDLSGIENISTIHNSLYIAANDNLVNLSGLEKLIFIGNDLDIRSNDKLFDISALLNLNSISNLEMYFNSSLTSLYGLDNVDPVTINRLALNWNPLLSECEVQSVCDYLRLNNGWTSVHWNAPGCDNIEEIEIACVSCLPHGITITSQSEIDDFEINYLGCERIVGDMIINGTEIIDLSVLNTLTSIGGNLKIFNTSLTKLSGLENITTIGGDLIIGDQSGGGNSNLVSLSGLDSLNSIKGDLVIQNNNVLYSLDGLDNLHPTSINNLVISNNPSLESCNARSICDFLSSNEGIITIIDNNNGCNSQVEVENDCTNGNPEQMLLIGFNIYPNPAKTKLFISNIFGLTVNEVLIYNQFGQKELSQHKFNEVIDISQIGSGMYIIEIITNELIYQEKIIIQ